MPQIHEDAHPKAGQTIQIKLMGTDDTVTLELEDWADRVTGRFWCEMDNNPAAISYAMRLGLSGGMIDNAVVYGKIEGMGCIVHVSEFID